MRISGADLRDADMSGADIDHSCLPLWCGAKFKADDRICKQIIAHAKDIMKRSDCGNAKLLKLMDEYAKGWHREKDFKGL